MGGRGYDNIICVTPCVTHNKIQWVFKNQIPPPTRIQYSHIPTRMYLSHVYGYVYIHNINLYIPPLISRAYPKSIHSLTARKCIHGIFNQCQGCISFSQLHTCYGNILLHIPYCTPPPPFLVHHRHHHHHHAHTTDVH